MSICIDSNLTEQLVCPETPAVKPLTLRHLHTEKWEHILLKTKEKVKPTNLKTDEMKDRKIKKSLMVFLAEKKK